MEPCDSCVKKYGINDLNSVNNCCFQKCANELGMDNVWDIVPTPCGQNCMECLNKAKLARGRSLCYQRRIGPPPIFVENYKHGKSSYNDYIHDHPLVFYIAFSAGVIILAIIFFIVIKVIFKDRKRKT